MPEPQSPLTLLGGLTPAQFMRHHWQRKPLLIRQAIKDFSAPVDAQALFALASQEEVQSRLIISEPDGGWELRNGPFKPKQIPTQSQKAWTMLVQGVDLYQQQAHALLQQFSFIPQARLDDLMISYASDQGGVGPHFDSYDVFLLQAKGTRRWRIGKQKDLTLQQGVPLRILEHFEAEEEWLLEPGDMLYLPPMYAHDGIAEGNDCMTYSIGFRSPNRAELASTLLERLAEPDDWGDDDEDGNEQAPAAHASVLYKDAKQTATATSGAIPEAMQQFARAAVMHKLQQPHAIEQLLGEYLSEPKAAVYFSEADHPDAVDGEWALAHEPTAIALNRKTRMLYDEYFLYINGESYRVAGKDSTLLRQLADRRALPYPQFKQLSKPAQEILHEWIDQGWLFQV
ncbi:cupin domain-containing protein [Lampropedia aestuarii]|uniref:Cupin domain-containing protein n=1 Tax=Lampropedia aestuarii TaxID=2562762 RepID=A0A4S5BT19_9BURK|nr:cupin domain-containing protein [Lampropedia aestuarii]MDH5857736.1 cupin domain-containing protein [Lampropedia aestuarii]THJ35987.1 cupin domain-containing protein [Lampropedia aestuarii]